MTTGCKSSIVASHGGKGGGLSTLFSRTALQAIADRTAAAGMNTVRVREVPDELEPGWHAAFLSGTSRSRAGGVADSMVVESINRATREITFVDNFPSMIPSTATIYFPAIAGWDNRLVLPRRPKTLQLKAFTYMLTVESSRIRASSGFCQGDYGGKHSFAWGVGGNSAWETVNETDEEAEEWPVLLVRQRATDRPSPIVYFDPDDNSLRFVQNSTENYSRYKHVPAIWDLFITGG